MKIQTRPRPPENPKGDLHEVGAEKSPSQHLGNTGFGFASASQVAESLEELSDASLWFAGSDLVPGLNLGVAAVEGFNSYQKYRQGESIVAATSAGNAAGSLGNFLGQASLAPVVFPAAGYLAVASVCAMVGGGLGIAAGAAEIDKGLVIRRAGLGSRTLAMGCLDICSGVTSLAGAGALASGSPRVGVGLLMTANVIDMTGIGVDYLWKRHQLVARQDPEVQPPTQDPPAPDDLPDDLGGGE